jgi:hypothetical protein
MLYRFREQQAAERGFIDTGSMRRPKVITQVDSIPVCKKWRGQVIRQISRAVTKIQDPSLSDYQIAIRQHDITSSLICRRSPSRGGRSLRYRSMSPFCDASEETDFDSTSCPVDVDFSPLACCASSHRASSSRAMSSSLKSRIVSPFSNFRYRSPIVSGYFFLSSTSHRNRCITFFNTGT